MSNSSEFLAVFNQIEAIFRERTGSGLGRAFKGMTDDLIGKDPLINRYAKRIDDFRELRNAITHGFKDVYDPIAEPHDVIVKQIKELLELLQNPKTVFDICVRDVGTTSMVEPLASALDKMATNGWTILPVVTEDGYVEKVLSEYSLLKALNSFTEADGVVLEASTVGDLSEFLDTPDSSDPQSSYQFVSRDTVAVELEKVFVKALREDRRINAVFVTQSGGVQQKLLGLITPWDMAQLDD